MNRSNFGTVVADRLFETDKHFKDFSDRCMKAHKSVMPMLLQRQRQKLAAFAGWSASQGMPLTTSESWGAWFYFDHPDLDWSWLLDWSARSVEGAIEHKMWGWTPHNYVQPQFENWQDVKWNRKLTSKFLKS